MCSNGRASISLLLLAAALAGCGGGPRKIPLEPPPRPPKFTPVVPAASATLDGAVAGLRDASTVDDAARAFDDVAQQDDPFGEALASALCAGMEQISELEDEEATGDNWEQFLVDTMVEQVGEESRSKVVDKVDGVLTTWELAQVNVRAAQVYWEACVRRT
jgi:hypothetical protein